MRARGSALLFGLVCAGGFALALALLVDEARHPASVVATVERTQRTGPTTTAEVRVRNNTRAARCVDVRAVAQDRDGRDLATSARSRLALPAEGRMSVTASLELTEQQYAEHFARVRAVAEDCRVERTVQK